MSVQYVSQARAPSGSSRVSILSQARGVMLYDDASRETLFSASPLWEECLNRIQAPPRRINPCTTTRDMHKSRIEISTPRSRRATSNYRDSNLAARLVVILARAHGADLLAHVVSQLELLLRDQLLHLRAGGLDVLLRTREPRATRGTISTRRAPSHPPLRSRRGLPSPSRGHQRRPPTAPTGPTGWGPQRTALMAACSLRSAARYAGFTLPLGRKIGMPYFDLPETCTVVRDGNRWVGHRSSLAKTG